MSGRDAALDRALALDAADPLADFRDEFGEIEPGLIYLDGNSLGRLPRATARRLAEVVDIEWREGLVRSWDTLDRPATRVGDRIATTLLGARPGEVVVSDSTTVNLYKAAVAALEARPGRGTILTAADEFPTDRYVLAGLARARGLAMRVVAADERHRARRGRTAVRAGRGRGPGLSEPRRVPQRRDRRPARHHRCGARRRRVDVVGPEPRCRLGAGRARCRGCGPGRRVHLQVPQRRPGRPGLPLRQQRSGGHAAPADTRLVLPTRPVRDGAGLRPASGCGSVSHRDPRRARPGRGRGGRPAARPGRAGSLAGQGNRVDRAGPVAGRRLAGAVGLRGRVTARSRPAVGRT